MSRIKTFMDFKNRQVDDIVSILDDVGQTAIVYRSQNPTDNPGFDVEIPNPTYYRAILVYIQPDRANVRAVSSEAGRGTEVRYIALTMDDDVRINDIWKIKTKEYQVFAIDDTSFGKTEVRLIRRV